MTAKIRLAIAALVTGLASGPVPALAQDAPPAEVPATTNQTNTSDQVGPRELKDFSLPGTVTRPADPQPSATTNSTTPAPRPRTIAPVTSRRAPPDATPAPSGSNNASERPIEVPARPAAAPAVTATRPASSVTVRLPAVGDLPTDSSAGGTAPALPSAPGNDVPLPWLVAAVMLLVGAGVYSWRNRRQQALVDGLDPYSFEPAPPPVREPGPRADPPIAPDSRRPTPEFENLGVVSTRLRPWLDIAFQPTRCRIDEENVTIEFELGLFNSGSTPARAILVEASFFNAGETQDREIEHFFANPVGDGGRAISLAPLKHMVIRSRVVTPRAQVREYEVGGRNVFVPLIGFNALYRWASGEGQTSTSFILGRRTDSEKLAPFRLDFVDREFRALDQRPLPQAVRR